MSDVQVRGQKRQADGDADEGAHKAWRLDDIDALGERLTFEELCNTLRKEFPDLATQWCNEFPELKQQTVEVDGAELCCGTAPELVKSGQAQAGEGQDDTRLESGRYPLVVSEGPAESLGNPMTGA